VSTASATPIPPENKISDSSLNKWKDTMSWKRRASIAGVIGGSITVIGLIYALLAGHFQTKLEAADHEKMQAVVDERLQVTLIQLVEKLDEHIKAEEKRWDRADEKMDKVMSRLRIRR